MLNDNNYAGAMKQIDEVLAADPNNKQALFAKGQIFGQQGNFKEAEKAFDKFRQQENTFDRDLNDELIMEAYDRMGDKFLKDNSFSDAIFA